jgi:mono/diheme cytochrome c family protein
VSKPNEGSDRIDYQETPDITEVHAAVEREKPEPSAEVTPMPLWLTGLCALATVWAGIYFGIFNGGLSGTVFNEYESSPAVLFPIPKKAGAIAGAGAGAEQTLAQLGKAVYGQCVACHQPGGQGVPAQFPPLANSEWVTGGEKRLIAVLLKGLTGPITLQGAVQTYSGNMVGWETSLSPKKIAAVASFIRHEWGNKAAEISEAKVVAAKKEFAGKSGQWTEAELAPFANENLPDAGGPAAPAAAQASAPAAPSAPAAGAPTSPPAAGTPAVPPAAGTPAAAPAPDPGVNGAELVAKGKMQYMMVCVACHQPTGMGLPMVFPPLVKSPYVSGSPERFAAIILKGNAGPFVVDGKNYNNMMPPQEAMLTDEKIAQIMSYTRSTFGNSAPPVPPEVVAATRQKFADRKTPWTQAELDAWKD